jgi:thioredoxin-related protein
MRLPIAPLSLLCSSLLLVSAFAGEGWLIDFEKAKAQAAAEKKDLLMDFTGSDWCGWCIRLRKEVFDTDEFKAQAPKKYVLLELDYPQDQSKVSDATRAQNDKLQSQFGIQGYPTIFLADSLGRPYAQLGYEKGGPEAYLKILEGAREGRVRRDDAFSKASASSGLQRAKSLKDALSEVPDALISTHYQEVLNEIRSLDASDSLGMDAKFGFIAGMKALESKMREQMDKGGEAVRGVADEFLKGYPKSGAAQKQQLLFGVLNYLRPPRDNEVALKLMEDVVALDKESPEGKRAEDVKVRIKAMIDKQKDAPKDPAK